MQKAKAVTKQADRAALYEKAQEIAKEEAPWITIAHSVRFDPVRKEVIGYKMDATAHHYFNKVDMARSEVILVTALRSYRRKVPATRRRASALPSAHYHGLAATDRSPCSPSSSSASASSCRPSSASRCSSSR